MTPNAQDTTRGTLAFPSVRAIDEHGVWRTGWAARPADPENPDGRHVLVYTDESDTPTVCLRRTLGYRVPLATGIIELYTGDRLETNGATYVVGFLDGSYRLVPAHKPDDPGMILTAHLLHACNWSRAGTSHDHLLTPQTQPGGVTT